MLTALGSNSVRGSAELLPPGRFCRTHSSWARAEVAPEFPRDHNGTAER